MPVAETEIPKHYVPTFERNVMHVPQQKYSKLEAFVDAGPAEGEGSSPIDEYSDTDAEESTDRYGDTPIMEVGRARRFAMPRKFHWGTLVDDMDKLKQVLDPTSVMVEAARMAMGRKLDRNIIMPAFFGAAPSGHDLTEALVNTPVAFDTAKYRIANVIGSSGGATPTGMNVQKIIEAKKVFMQNEVDTSSERVNIAITAQQWADLFAEQKAINGDFVNGRPIESGQLSDLLQCNLIQVEQLPSSGLSPNDRYNPCWVQSGIALRHWMQITVKIAEDSGKQFRIRVYIKRAAGAVRTQEGKVLQIVNREP